MSRQLILARTQQMKENSQLANTSMAVLQKQNQPWEETDYKKMLVSMVHSFKRRSRSRGRHQVTT